MTSAFKCAWCERSAVQFIYIDGAPVCPDCYRVSDYHAPPDFMQATDTISDGVRELREWCGLTHVMLARRLGVPVESLERFEQNWATDAEKLMLQHAFRRLLNDQ